MVIGGTGDEGGDVLGVRSERGQRRVFVVQVKATIGGNYIGINAIEQAVNAMSRYSAHVAVAATNGDFTASAYRRRDHLRRAGFDVRLWNGTFLKELLGQWPEDHSARIGELRAYQQDIIQSCLEAYTSGRTACQFVVATGLGKTVIAAELLARLFARDAARALVLCHQQVLALQLEQAFWRQLGRSIPTRTFFEGVPPKPIEGINFGLYQTFASYVSGIDAREYDVVIVDEAHHALAHGFRRCLSHLEPRFLLGMTATPWRGDGKSTDAIFGPPVAHVSLMDGMKMGYLARIDYRIFCDTIEWKLIPRLTGGKMTIRDLNKRLFVPQRDDAAAQEISRICRELPDPRIMIFSPSIEHCRRFAGVFSSVTGMPCRPLSGVDRRDRYRSLMEFSSGRVPAVVAVDVLNEGIDVPETNLIVFLRATHSRRIFVQQLGRGLRIAGGKNRVIVADFVTDIRRLAEIVSLDTEARRPPRGYCTLSFDQGIVTFADKGELPFITQWLQDVSDLAGADDSHVLAFPEAI
ncbi:DEAD/DEAH box helicase [Planctomycetota bacterium]